MPRQSKLQPIIFIDVCSVASVFYIIENYALLGDFDETLVKNS